MNRQPTDPVAGPLPVIAAFLAGALCLAPSSAQDVQQHEFLIEDSRAELCVTGGQVAGFTQPLHGVVQEGDIPTVGGAQLVYVPDADGDFWTVGHDSFDVDIEDEGGRRTERVLLIAASRTQHMSLSDFETVASSGVEVDADDQLEVSTAGRIIGGQGALVEVAAADLADAYVVLPAAPETLGEGGDHGGCAEMMEEGGALEPPPRQGDPGGSPGPGVFLPEGTVLSAACQLYGDCVVSLLQIYDSAEQRTAFDVRLTLSPQGAALQLRGFEAFPEGFPGTERTAAWFPITDQAHRLRLDWWIADEQGRQGGAVLRVDGRVAGELRGLENDYEGPQDYEYRAGAIDATPGLAIVYRLDHLERYGGDPRSDVTPHTVNGFEEDWSGWEPSMGAGTVQLSAAAALNGNFGIEAEVGTAGGWGTFLKGDAFPAPPAVAVVRFGFAADYLSLGETFALLLAGYHDATAGGQSFKMSFSEQGPDLLLTAKVRDDANAWFDVLSTDLDPGGHVAELQWSQSDGPDVANGCLRIWLDGDLRGECCGVDIDEAALERIRLGLMNVQSSTNGSLFLDTVEVTVSTP